MSNTIPTVVMRFDASPQIGGGHAVRCLVLADLLAERGWRCLVACSPETFSQVPRALAGQHEILEIECIDREEPDWLRRMLPAGVDILLVDHFHRDCEFEQRCRGWARTIVAIDGLLRGHDCDLLVDPNSGRDSSSYEGLLPGHCRILSGSEYRMLHPSFARLRKPSLARRSEGACDSILVQFGAGEDDGAMEIVLRGLQRSGFVGTVHVIGRGTAMLNDGPYRDDQTVRIVRHGWIDDAASLMEKVDLMVGAGGGMLWEACCLGVPQLLVEMAPNQAWSIQQACRAGAAIRLGNRQELTAEKVAMVVSRHLQTPQLLWQMSNEASKLCDGLGTARVADALAVLLDEALSANVCMADGAASNSGRWCQ